MIRDFFRIQKINSDSHGGGSCGGGGQEASQLTGCNKKIIISHSPAVTTGNIAGTWIAMRMLTQPVC